MSGSWLSVVLEIPSRDEDEVAGRLSSISRGIELIPQSGERTRLRVYLLSSLQADEALRLAREVGGPEAGEPRLEETADGKWVERYQASLRPFPLGAGFIIFPSGEVSESQGRTPVRLVPGRAFGTGEHSTTRMCVEILESHVRPESRWLDLGTGSGILAIVARHCGAAEVLALDVDPEAIAVAREVLEQNGATGVETGVGSLETAAGFRPDGIVCNISVVFLVTEAGGLHTALEGGGTLIATGFSTRQFGEVEASLREAGFESLERFEHGEWGALVASRPRGG